MSDPVALALIAAAEHCVLAWIALAASRKARSPTSRGPDRATRPTGPSGLDATIDLRPPTSPEEVRQARSDQRQG